MAISTVYHFVDSKLRAEISSKKRGQQKMGALKWWIDAPLLTCIGASRKFYAKSIAFCYYYCFFWWPKTIASTSSIFFYPLIIGFFWFAKLWLKFEEKIHTKVTVNVSRGGEGLEDVLHGSGANDLPWRRKGLPGGPREEWNYTD